MKKLLFMAAMIAASFNTFAQESGSKMKFQVGINAALPIGDLADVSSFGAGVDIQGQYSFSDNVAGTLDAGYTGLFGKDNFKMSTLIPVRAGVRISTESNFFFTGKVGVGFFKQGKWEAGGITIEPDGVTTFAYSVGAGYKLSEKMDLGLSYDAYSKNGTSNLLNLRLGIGL